MSITEDLANILSARYGKDVRQSIHDGIQHCYDKQAPTQEEVAPVVEAYLEEHPITADAELSTTSINPIQNKAVAESISQLNSNIASLNSGVMVNNSASITESVTGEICTLTLPSKGVWIVSAYIRDNETKAKWYYFGNCIESGTQGSNENISLWGQLMTTVAIVTENSKTVNINSVYGFKGTVNMKAVKVA